MADTRAKRDNSSNSPNLAAVRNADHCTQAQVVSSTVQPSSVGQDNLPSSQLHVSAAAVSAAVFAVSAAVVAVTAAVFAVSSAA